MTFKQRKIAQKRVKGALEQNSSSVLEVNLGSKIGQNILLKRPVLGIDCSKKPLFNNVHNLQIESAGIKSCGGIAAPCYVPACKGQYESVGKRLGRYHWDERTFRDPQRDHFCRVRQKSAYIRLEPRIPCQIHQLAMTPPESRHFCMNIL